MAQPVEFEDATERERVLGADLDRYLRDLIEAEVPENLIGLVEYHLGWRNERLEAVAGLLGKRGRPMLTMLVYLLFHGDHRPVVPVAASVELVHNFSLVFDDIQDRDAIRRGRPAVWSLWGEDEAINVGLALSTLVWVSLQEALPHYAPHTARAVQRELADAMMRMNQGQQMDVRATKTPVIPDMAAYLDSIAAKTAALFECASRTGAVVAGARLSDQERAGSFGHAIGMAFQVLDDVVGIWGRPEHGLDKPRRDIVHRKKTYPVLYAYAHGSDAQRAVIERFFMRPTSPDVPDRDQEMVRDILEDTGSREESVALGRHYLALALDELQAVDGDPLVRAHIQHWVEFVTGKQLGMM